ncbi:DUF1127 domain-containing protein [Pseudooceanicola nanhaiensis]|uniref:DUF1127 domain-containing protein n=1 Tax=Pseudooceanicola nanhaiensis TaxID=375761 RepID=UPI001CD61D01|nr:DUF1127 domain-containing protein [Pseudooceanicola nanhaiensis]MCA0922513.1 DUF1127 domain-containing protein [Pseudooceanicola nanhaiensis]
MAIAANTTRFQSDRAPGVITRFFEAFGSALRAHRLCHELSSLTDAQLAGMGLKREEIPAYVFRAL